MKNIKFRVVLLTSLALFFTALPVFAHHSFEAEFNYQTPITLKGVFTRIDWINPHIYFFMDAKDDSGKVTQWSIESYPTGFMHRAGITRDEFQLGQPITVAAFRAKDGTNLVWMTELILSSGKKIEFGCACAQGRTTN